MGPASLGLTFALTRSILIVDGDRRTLFRAKERPRCSLHSERAKGIWRDDDRGGNLLRDEPVVIHCYTTPERIEDDGALAELGSFCPRMGREAGQGEVGVVVGDEYFAIRDFSED